MARRVVAGILGGVAGILPLVLVNLLVNTGGALGDVQAVAVEYALALGVVALLGGVLAGGGLAGWLGARRGGGIGAAGMAGALAAALYAVTVILVLVGGARQGWGPSVAAIHPIRVSAAIILVACLLLGVALITGAVVRRGQAAAAVRATGRQVVRRARQGDEMGYAQGYGTGYGPRNAQGHGQGYGRGDRPGSGASRPFSPSAARSYHDPREGEGYPAAPTRPRTPGPSSRGTIPAPPERSRGRGGW